MRSHGVGVEDASCVRNARISSWKSSNPDSLNTAIIQELRVMSLLQPAPKKSPTGTIIVIVVVVVTLAAGLGGYGAYRIFQSSVQPSLHRVDISGNSLSESVSINDNSTVSISCNYCNITLQVPVGCGQSWPLCNGAVYQHVRADLDISGNYNHVTVNGGEANISVTGNYNTVNAQHTVVLSVQNTGNGNTVQR
jgi:hypothetical protein